MAAKSAPGSLSRKDFEVLRALAEARGAHRSQRDLSAATGLSLGTVNAALNSLLGQGFVAEGVVTGAGVGALAPYRVDNAIIMAAGSSTRFAPISYDRPKGLLSCRGEVLIERQIRQLREAGVRDIAVVVGYKREFFFYLAGQFGVRIVENPGYESSSTAATLLSCGDLLGNTYLICADDYFVENPFRAYEYRAWYACVEQEGPTNGWCATRGTGGRITGITLGGEDACVMLDHAYLDRAFSRGLLTWLAEARTHSGFDGLFWEDVWREHLGELAMTARVVRPGTTYDFNTPAQLAAFDPLFLDNVSPEVLDAISGTLGCPRDSVRDCYPLAEGYTNVSCHFAVDGREYVWRHPGVGTEAFIDRASEAEASRVAHRLGLDATFLKMDPDAGWRLTRFVDGARSLDPADDAEVQTALGLLRVLHESGEEVPSRFDRWADVCRLEGRLFGDGPFEIPGYAELREKVTRLHELAAADGFPTVLSHGDCWYANFLVDPRGHVDLIDWERASMRDEGDDLGYFCCCAEYGPERFEQAVAWYLGREPDERERRHYLACLVIAGWWDYLWCLDYEAQGYDAGPWLLLGYQCAAQYAARALALYGE